MSSDRSRYSGWAFGAALMLLSSLCVAGEQRDPAHWIAECQADGQAFQLIFDSPSQDVDNADMTVTLALADGRKVLLPLSPGTYRARPVVSNEASLCSGIGAFASRDQVYKGTSAKLLLWLSVDNRPGWDTLSLALLDLSEAKLLHSVERVAPIKDPDGRQALAVQVTPEGYSVRLERQWLQNTGSDSAANSIEDWMLVSVAHQRIRSQWR